MARNLSRKIYFDKQAVNVVAIPEMRQDGLYYEVNIKGYPRFFMTWTELGRYDVAKGEDVTLPYNLILAVSDMLEGEKKKR